MEAVSRLLNGAVSVIVKEQVTMWFEHFHAYSGISWKGIITTTENREIFVGIGIGCWAFDDLTDDLERRLSHYYIIEKPSILTRVF